MKKDRTVGGVMDEDVMDSERLKREYEPVIIKRRVAWCFW